MKKHHWIILVVVVIIITAVSIYVIMKKPFTFQKKNWLKKLFTGNDATTMGPILDKMTPDEIETTYIYLHDYVNTNNKAGVPTDLQTKVQAISAKYGIFG